MYRMNFGRWSGHLVRDVPDGYLRWALRECTSLEPWLRHAIESELQRRGIEAEDAPQPGRHPPPADVRRVVTTWYREMALRYHPDRTLDDGTAMRAINHAHERLMQLLGVA